VDQENEAAGGEERGTGRSGRAAAVEQGLVIEWSSCGIPACRLSLDHEQSSLRQSCRKRKHIVHARPAEAAVLQAQPAVDDSRTLGVARLRAAPVGCRLEFYQPVESSTLPSRQTSRKLGFVCEHPVLGEFSHLSDIHDLGASWKFAIRRSERLESSHLPHHCATLVSDRDPVLPG
jgi:hypothetical protein